VDAAIVMVEQAHRNIERWQQEGRIEGLHSVVLRAMKQTARPSFFALLVIAATALPVLTLQAEEGRLFRPLALANCITILVASILVITVGPALRLTFVRIRPFQFEPSWLCRVVNKILIGAIRSEEQHPITRRFARVYAPIVEWSLRRKEWVFLGALVLMISTIPVYYALGTEFMPPLDEGVILYMPSTGPGISLADAQRLLRATDAQLKQFPEVEHVLGKIGRADTSTDPAPLSMLETVVVLREKRLWRSVPTWYSSWAPEWVKPVLRHVTNDRLSKEELVRQMNEALRLPGVTNTWSMPIRGRIDMLSTGLRTPLGIKVIGNNFSEIERLGGQVADILSSVPGTRGVFPEPIGQGRYLDVQWNRQALARYGISLADAQETLQYAIGGESVTTMVNGRERYPINVRFPTDSRDTVESLGRVVVFSRDGRWQAPISMLANVKTTFGPTMFRNEGGLLTGYIYIDAGDADQEKFVESADVRIRREITLPSGYSITWAGQYESALRGRRQLVQVIPLTLLLIVLLLYVNTRSLSRTLLVLLAVPFSAVGAIWILYLAGFHMSVAVWVGLVVLLGVDAETGVFMLLYLDQAYDSARRENRLDTREAITRVVMEGAARRLRPKLMTTATMFIGLLPVLWSSGTGSDRAGILYQFH